MRLALDTNRYVDLCRGDAAVVDCVARAAQVFLPFVVMGELRAGFRLGRQTRGNERSLQRFLALPKVDVLFASETTTVHYAEVFAQLREQGTRADQRHVDRSTGAGTPTEAVFARRAVPTPSTARLDALIDAPTREHASASGERRRDKTPSLGDTAAMPCCRTTASLATLTLLLATTAAQAPTSPVAPPIAPAVAPSPAQPPVPGFHRDGTVRDPNWFPLGVWLQDPANAARYRALGVTLYVGLWDGPTQPQLRALAKASMPVICHHNTIGANDRSGTILAWMHNDEPDNAQGRRLQGYAPPIAPAKVQADYRALRAEDAERPVFLNLGQGAAWDGWHGRGERSGHAEDYPEYLQGCDIGSFDIYPVTHPHRDVQGKLEFVARGVQRLRGWTDGKKPVWACIETGHVANAKVRPTPQQVRDEAWLAIAAGASGLIWFCHEFAPQFVEAGLLAHDDVAAAVRAVDEEVLALAPVLNSPRRDERVEVQVEGGTREQVAVRVHEHGGALHVFVAALRQEPVTVTIRLRAIEHGTAQVAHGPPVPLVDGRFTLPLPGHATRHCRITSP